MKIPLPILDEDTTSALHLATSILPCDAWHHYYHYQSSAQYLWLAITLHILDKNDEAIIAYDRAIFQDHFNQEAIEGRKRVTTNKQQKDGAPTYNKHPILDAEFCSSIGKQSSKTTESHDKAVTYYLDGKYELALSLLTDKGHSNSRFFAGKCFFALKQYENASREFTEAIRLSHTDHITYHLTASDEHLARGKKWLDKSEVDLAIADFTKALDLHRLNKEALRMRSEAYRVKGNIKMAQADESALR